MADSFANDEIDAEQPVESPPSTGRALQRSSCCFVLKGFAGSGRPSAPDIASRWADVPIERQRSVIDCLMTVRVLR